MSAHSIVGKRPLVGATNQNESSLLEFSATWVDPSGTTVNANCSATFQTATMKHEADIRRLKDGKGGRCTVIASDEAISLDVVAVPFGLPTPTAGDALPNALKAAYLPAALSFVAISNAPNIGCGPFPPAVSPPGGALNADNWLYEGGGTVEIASETEWGLKFTLVRSPNIAKQNAVVL